MLRRNNFIMILIVSILSLIFCGVETDAQQPVNAAKSFEKGIVDIEIREFQIVNGKEVAWKDNPTVLPGDYLSKIPRIYNYGVDCYVRVKITFREPEVFTEEQLFGMSDEWIKGNDGYYYYKEILKTGKTIDVFHGLEIQSNLSEDMSERTFHIDIDAEAIQSTNFAPDFEAADPWENAEVGDSTGKDSVIREPVKTGDAARAEVYAVFLGAGSFGLVLLERKRKGA